MLLLPLKKVTAPAPWAAAEPETAGKGLCPLPVLCGSQAADFNNIKAKSESSKKLLFYLKFQIIDGKVAYINIFI